MPLLEPVTIEGRGYSLRLIGPKAKIWPNPPINIPTRALLNQTAMIARPLPMTNNPNSPDMVEGFWTGRLFDAGELSLTFPNKEASDGQAWRDRFDPDKKNEWIEIWNDEYLESVCCVEKVDKKRDQIVVSGHDGWFQLKSAFERDWVCLQAPRDVIERGTQVWAQCIVDSFPYNAGALNPQWTNLCTGTGNVTLMANNGLLFTAPAGATGVAEIATGNVSLPVVTTSVWSAQLTWSLISIGAGGPPLGNSQLFLNISESSGDTYSVSVGVGANGTVYASFGAPGASKAIQIASSVSYGFLMESDGEWVTGYVNGQIIGGARRSHSVTSSLKADIATVANTGAIRALASSILVETLQPWLQRGNDKGDYVLPGTVSAYPAVGLHARYYNDADLQGDSNRPFEILHPLRSQAYASSGAPEYANQQDAVIAGQQNPLPGAPTSNWSVKWFGAIYLKLSQGDYTFTITLPGIADNFGVRAWIGKTKFGDQLVDQWTAGGGGFTNGAGAVYTFTVTGASLMGTLSFGGGTVKRDGWYSIKIEYAVDSIVAAGPLFKLTNYSGGAYVDPGGTVIASGAQSNIVPSSSLSPLGMIDERYQGVAHYDVVQKVMQAFAYQATLEPQSLESDLFPGVVAPRLREGQDFDAILEPDDVGRTEGLLNYGNLLDATDTCTSLQGNGAGFQSGNTGQLQARVFDSTSLQQALFDIQGWADFSDASFLPLLQALLNSQLGLRLTPWQIITGDPVGRHRLANMWPLPGPLAQMRWRPGDGMLVFARDIGVQDTTPRQILVVTRQIHPNGSTATQVSFAARPRTPQAVMKTVMFQAQRWQRNYQRTQATLSGAYVDTVTVAAGATSVASTIALSPADTLVHAYIRIAGNSTGQQLDVLVNGVSVSPGITWKTTPIVLPVDSVAVPDNSNRLIIQIKNTGGIGTNVSFQAFADVLR